MPQWEPHRRAQGKPCPWCSVTDGFRRTKGAKEEGTEWLLSLKGMVEVALNPRRIPELFVTNPLVYCNKCSERVIVCRGYDSPLRYVQFFQKCPNCGAKVNTG